MDACSVLSCRILPLPRASLGVSIKLFLDCLDIRSLSGTFINYYIYLEDASVTDPPSFAGACWLVLTWDIFLGAVVGFWLS